MAGVEVAAAAGVEARAEALQAAEPAEAVGAILSFFTLALIFVSNLDTEQKQTWREIRLDPKRAITRKQTDERQLFNALVSPLTTLPSNYSQNVVQKPSPSLTISTSILDPPWIGRRGLIINNVID